MKGKVDAVSRSSLWVLDKTVRLSTSSREPAPCLDVMPVSWENGQECLILSGCKRFVLYKHIAIIRMQNMCASKHKHKSRCEIVPEQVFVCLM